MVSAATPELLEAAESVFDGWHADEKRIDWERLLDRLDGMELSDGTIVDLGCDMTAPVILTIKWHVRAYRRLAS